MCKRYRKQNLGTNGAIIEEAYLIWRVYNIRDGIFSVPLELMFIK